MSAPPSHWLWEQHCCLPLHFNADITELARYPGGSYVSVNVGYSRQDKDQSSGPAIAKILGGNFARIAEKVWAG